MKLIFLYGPPATGKLTIARELSKITEYKVFHNHLTADLVSSIFPFGTEEYSSLVEKVRLDLLESAAKAKVKGVIFTFVYGIETYGGKSDDSFVKKVVKIVRKHKGKVIFVKLQCKQKELYRRMKQPAREAFHKIREIKILKSIMKKYDLGSPIPFVKNLIIDNTTLAPRKVASMIKGHYKL